MEPLQSNMRITDMNIDCLEEVSKHLNLTDLLNIADSSKRLNKAANFVFNQKHGNKLVRFVLCVGDQHRLVRKNGDTIFIVDFYTSLRFVRCFGQLISRIDLDWMQLCTEMYTKPAFVEIFRYMNEYCTQNLIELRVRNLSCNIIEQIVNPFEKLEKISFENCELKIDSTTFRKIFPKMRYLNLRDNQMVNSAYVGNSFPHLDTFVYRPCLKMSSDEQNNLKIFVRLNPQLNTIKLYECLDASLIRYMSEHLHQLEEFSITLYDTVDPDFDISQVHFKSVKKFQIASDKNDSFSKFTPSFDQLEQFIAGGMPTSDLQIFVKTNPAIKKFTIEHGFNILSLTLEDTLGVSKALNSLNDLDISNANIDEVTAEDAIRFMAELKQLKKFKIKLHHSEVIKLLTQLNKEWQIVDPDPPNLYFIVCEVTLERYSN